MRANRDPENRKLTGDKVARMAAALAKFEEGAVYLPEGALWFADLEAKLFAFLLTAAMTASAPPSVGPQGFRGLLRTN
jgi:hypothetical protein